MFNKSIFKKNIAEKQDGMKAYIHNLFPQDYIEELKKIPRLVLGHVSGIESMVVLYASLTHIKADALVLMSAYTGTGYGEQKTLWKDLQALKSAIEKTRRIYCVGPIVIGAPQFWRALNGRFVQELISRYRFYCPCFGCRLYLCALTIPLCKALNIETVASGNISGRGGGGSIFATNTANYYCAHLLSSFGIKLMYNIVNEETAQKVKTEMNIKTINEEDDCFPCVFQNNCRMLDTTWKEPPHLNLYFERFLIPATAKIISKVLSGRDFDYCDEVADVLMPGTKLKYKKKRGSITG
jgi:hypothetical protein